MSGGPWGGCAWDVRFLGWEVTPQPWQPHTPLSDEQPGGTTQLDRRSQQLLTRLRARVAAGQEQADQFRPTDLEEWFAVSSTTAQDWLHQWQEQGLLEPARTGQRIRSWRLREPWQQWVLGQPPQRE